VRNNIIRHQIPSSILKELASSDDRNIMCKVSNNVEPLGMT
jgi:hypothetical protein